MENRIKNIIKTSISVKESLLETSSILKTIEEVVNVITVAFQNGNRVYFCGNGGSAADAQHLAAEFSGRFYKDRKSLPSEALHCNTSYMTAVANDYSYDVVYSRLIEGIANKGDVLIGLSTSGNSVNILNAFNTSKVMGITTIGLTGSQNGLIDVASDFKIKIPSSDTPRIQESHILVGHIICELVESNLFSEI
jgi:D-sedoheptulose 7-phosphate isomerase